jgi:hypothetical protein
MWTRRLLRADHANPGGIADITRPPGHRPQPRQQFFHVERPGDIVIRPSVERRHGFDAPHVTGQHHEGRPAPSAQVADDLDATHIREIKVYNDQRWRVLCGRSEAGLPAGHNVGLVAVPPEADPKNPRPAAVRPR